MRWYYWPLFALVMGLMLGGSVTASYLQPIENHRTVQATEASKNPQQGESENRCERKPFWEKTTCDPVAFFTLLLAALTGGLWLATQKILREAQRTTEKQLRAYVGIVTAKFNPPPSITVTPSELIFTITNVGATPAHSMEAFVNWCWFGPPIHDLAEDYEYIDYNNGIATSSAMLIPNHPIEVHIPLGEYGDKINQFRRGEISLFYYGHIDYTDVFGKRRHTHLCYANRHLDESRMGLVVYKTHNHFD